MICSILAVALKELLAHACYSGRSVLKSFPFNIFSNPFEEKADRCPNLLVINHSIIQRINPCAGEETLPLSVYPVDIFPRLLSGDS